MFGNESHFDGSPLSESLRFRFPPKRFGRRFVDERSISQPEDPGRIDPPGGIHFIDPAAKTYTYMVRFKPCPRRGSNVKRC